MRRVVVTGGSSGIGLAAAREMAREGDAIVLVARRVGPLAEAAESLRHEGARQVETVTGDVADPSLGKRIAKAAQALGGGELCLINAAGQGGFGPLDSLRVEDVDNMVRVNLLGTMLACHALLPGLRNTKGQVVNVASIAGLRTLPGASVYGATKAGVIAFTRGLSEDERRNGVRATVISPGATATPIWDNVRDHPPFDQMLSPEVVGAAIRDVLLAPRDRAFDEVVLMPPFGIL